MNRKQREAFIAALKAAFVVETICSSALPASYRRDILRQEMRTADNATAEYIIERIVGRLDDDDPLSVLLGWS